MFDELLSLGGSLSNHVVWNRRLADIHAAACLLLSHMLIEILPLRSLKVQRLLGNQVDNAAQVALKADGELHCRGIGPKLAPGGD